MPDISGTGRPVTEFELFEEWAVAKHHYQTVAAIARFKLLQGSRNGDETDPPVLDAATLAMLEKLED